MITYFHRAKYGLTTVKQALSLAQYNNYFNPGDTLFVLRTKTGHKNLKSSLGR